jgi:PEP-CTERM motif
MNTIPSKLSLALGFFVTAVAFSPSLHAQAFVNGGFDDGTTTGWTVGSGNRSGAAFGSLNPASYLGLNGGGPSAGNRSAVVSPGLDPVLGALMPNIVFGGTNSYRVEDAGVIGGWLSVISQTVTNYSAPDIFFAWMAVLDNGGHSQADSAGMIITLTDVTTNTLLINRRYNAGNGGGGVDPRFSSSGSLFYTPQWQIEQLSIDALLANHTFTLTVLATDCGPTGHTGYVYLDGFGAVAPPAGPIGAVPEPSTYGMIGAAALVAAVVARRRKQAQV